MFELVNDLLKPYRIKTILEVACGTGRLMTILEEKGYEATGLDLSQEMLDIARKRCRGRLLRQDMRDIKVTETFDALICLGKGFAYMLTDADVEMALDSFNRVLRDGGALVFDSFDAERSRRYAFGEWRKTVFEFEDMRVTRLSRSLDYKESDSTWLAEWKYIIETEGEKHIIKDETRLRSFDRDQLKDMLVCHGFQVVDIANEQDLIFKANKR